MVPAIFVKLYDILDQRVTCQKLTMIIIHVLYIAIKGTVLVLIRFLSFFYYD